MTIAFEQVFIDPIKASICGGSRKPFIVRCLAAITQLCPRPPILIQQHGPRVLDGSRCQTNLAPPPISKLGPPGVPILASPPQRLGSCLIVTRAGHILGRLWLMLRHYQSVDLRAVAVHHPCFSSLHRLSMLGSSLLATQQREHGSGAG